MTNLAKVVGITGYTHSMKTAVSIPNDLFEAAEQVRRQSGESRSALYAAAIRSYLLRRSGGVRQPGSWAGRFETHETEEEAIGSDPDVVAMFAASAEIEDL